MNPIAYVVAVGPGLPMDDGRRYPMDVKVGDKVQLLRTLTDAILEGVPDEHYWLCDVGQILGVVEEAPEERVHKDVLPPLEPVVPLGGAIT